MNLSAAFTTSADVTGPGKCRCYWLFEDNHWTKVNKPAASKIIFDKFSPFNTRQKKQRDLMFSSSKIRPFNEPKLYNLFFDKHSTYKSLSTAAIPTVLVSNSDIKSVRQSINSLHKLLESHPNRNDFANEYVFKDRHGSAGQHVYHLKKDNLNQIETIMKSKAKMQFILQPMVKFNKGFTYKNNTGRIEIRLIFMGEKVVQTYIRIAPKDGFRCNDHQGGTSLYIKVSDVPKKVISMAHSITQTLPNHDSLYALDFLVSNNDNPYLLEGNTGPGLNWDKGKRIDRIKSQQLIRIIVAKLKQRIEKSIPPLPHTTPFITPHLVAQYLPLHNPDPINI